MRTAGLPLRLGIGILTATSAYAGVFASRGGGSGAEPERVFAAEPVLSNVEAVALCDTASGARAGYMVTSGRGSAR